MVIVAQTDIKSNYYYIRKVPTGREGVCWPTQNRENVQNGSKTIAQKQNLGPKILPRKGHILMDIGHRASEVVPNDFYGHFGSRIGLV